MRRKVGNGLNQRQKMEDRCKDGRNIPSSMTVEQEQKYLRGVFAEDNRGDYRCGGFQKEWVNTWNILGSSNPNFWSDEAFTPDGVPDGDVYEPRRNKREEPMCNLRGYRIY
jgi:hypothetical protein